MVNDRNQWKLDALTSKYGIKTSLNQHDVMQSCEIIFVAVKPFYMNGVLDNVKDKVTKEHLIVSVAAGYSLDQMAEHLPPETRIVRVMPNTPSAIGEGVLPFVATMDVDDERLQLTHELLGTCGEAMLMAKEAYIDVDPVT